MSKNNSTPYSRSQVGILLFSVFVIAFCGILYELLIGTLSTYFLGSSVLHFSITIGLFLSFMGVGSWCSKYLHEPLLEKFILIELGLGVIGGFSALILYSAFSLTEHFYLVAFIITALLGIGIGLEIPLIARIIQQQMSIRDTLAEVFSFDYIGALIASILFPLILLPYFGTVKSGFLIGILNTGIALLNVYSFQNHMLKFRKYLVGGWSIMTTLWVGFASSFYMVSMLEEFLYRDEIIYTEQSPYQRIVVTQWNTDVRLYLNGNLQFSSIDEYRYHEALVHVGMLSAPKREKVLLLGAGDGLATREILKYEDVKEVHLVDLDPSITKLAKNHWLFKQLNNDALNHPKVKVYNQDAWAFIEKNSDFYDVIIADLPDPNDTGLGKLYSREFYEMVKKRLSLTGIFITQATSPYFALRSFWCIHHTLSEVFAGVHAYHVYVPSFGDWGFQWASHFSIPRDTLIQRIQKQMQAHPLNYRYLKAEELAGLFYLGADCDTVDVPIQTLERQILVELYEHEWHQWHN